MSESQGFTGLAEELELRIQTELICGVLAVLLSDEPVEDWWAALQLLFRVMSLCRPHAVRSGQRFLCLKNIRTFLCACSEVFGMKKSELFRAL
ncbi:hypothetical protein NFI96_003877 [Prochilodus magdalenae]|nr:hypothetical protein NFI96_003877 [Prochilodus magdalenae]